MLYVPFFYYCLELSSSDFEGAYTARVNGLYVAPCCLIGRRVLACEQV